MQKLDTSQCVCIQSGFCPIFQKIMDGTNLKWCQNASEEEREIYKESYRGPIPFTPEVDRFLHQYDCAEEVETLPKTEIAILGHSPKQFDTISDRPYLKKVYLDDLDLGKYHKRFQSNYFSESRAFLCDDLFDDGVEYVGVATASWNIKYQGLNPIDNFHNWCSAKAMFRSKRDNVLLCADTNSTLAWFGKYTDEKNIDKHSSPFWANFHNDNHVFKSLGFSITQMKLIWRLLQSLKLSLSSRPTANSHQFICHRNLYNRYIKFFREKEILPRVTNLWKRHDMVTHNPHTDTRPVGYVIECISMMWLNSQEDVLVIPNEGRAGAWSFGSSPERELI